MRRLILVTLLLQVAACSGAAQPVGPLGIVDGDGAAMASVMHVSCVDGSLHLDTDRVRVQADGLHVEITALDPDVSVQIRSLDETDPFDFRSAGGAHRTGTTVISTVAPGPVLVRCYPDDGPRHMLSITEDDQAVAAEIIDDRGLWTQPDPLDCDGLLSHVDPLYASEPAPPSEPVEPLTDAVDTTGREVDGVLAYGYPEGTTRWASVVEDDRIVTRGTYVRDGTSWRVIGLVSCG